MKTSDLSKLMTEAWRLFRVTGESFSECLKKAWKLYKLKASMKRQIVQFHYKKISGEIRQAFGTLNEKYLPESKGSDRKKNDLLFTYFDTEVQGYRSFKIMNLVSIN